ncbi:exported hypothetical protein [Mesorhizobium plurifarium]|uniref:Uncharacterized protein n=1 Tax=Mesorhizobium plurifarium TaxID=69974 RepID=A0A0K2VZ28_MESPL|nr:exported hypothetical protein [Mesorhizobium plurifarium]
MRLAVAVAGAVGTMTGMRRMAGMARMIRHPDLAAAGPIKDYSEPVVARCDASFGGARK